MSFHCTKLIRKSSLRGRREREREGGSGWGRKGKREERREQETRSRGMEKGWKGKYQAVRRLSLTRGNIGQSVGVLWYPLQAPRVHALHHFLSVRVVCSLPSASSAVEEEENSTERIRASDR